MQSLIVIAIFIQVLLFDNNATASIRLKRSKCPFRKQDLEAFTIDHQDGKRNIDGEKFLTFLKQSPDESVNGVLMKFLQKNLVIPNNDPYKLMLKHVADQHGFENSRIDKHVTRLSEDIRREHLPVQDKARSRLPGTINSFMSIHAIYGGVMTCSKGIFNAPCAESAGGLVWSFAASKPIERAVVNHLTPKLTMLTLQGAKLVGTKFPKFGFALRLVGTRATSAVVHGLGGAIGGAFDIVDIGIQINTLIYCDQRRQKNNPCTARQIRDSIASIAFSGVSFITGIATLAAAAPGIGTIISIALVVAQAFYFGFSAVEEYKTKYHTTDDENFHIFLATVFLQDMPDDVKQLVERTDYIKAQSKRIWESLEKFEMLKAYGMGLGVSSSIDLYKRDPKISERVSRVIPRDIDSDAEMICLPTISGEIYEKNLVNNVPSAVYRCDNAIVFAHKNRTEADMVILNLELVQKGTIYGSDKWRNIYNIYKSRSDLWLYGGASKMNRFIFYVYPFEGQIEGGANAINILDFSKSDANYRNVIFDYHDFLLTLELLTTNGKSKILQNGVYQPSVDKYYYVGKVKSQDDVRCSTAKETNPFLFIDSGGGTMNAVDRIVSCRNVILSPFTAMHTIEDLDYTVYIRSKNYDHIRSKSSIHNRQNRPVNIIFNDFELINGDTMIEYFPYNKTMHVVMNHGMENEFLLIIEGYKVNADNGIHLFNKNKHLVRPRIDPLLLHTSMETGTVINFFETHVSCPRESLQNVFQNLPDDCVDSVNSRNKYDVLTTIYMQNQFALFTVGSNRSDVLTFAADVKFAKGGKGQDVYVVLPNVKKILSSIKRELYIFNDAEDKELDFVMMPVVPRTFSIQGDHLQVATNDLVLEIRDFMKSERNQHIVFVSNGNDDTETFIPLVIDETSNKLVPFIHATPTQNVFILQAAFAHSSIVVDAIFSELQFFKDGKNLIIFRESPLLSVVIENFYLNPKKWLRMKWYLYSNGVLSEHDDLPYPEFIRDYKEKLKRDYNAMVQEYTVDFSNSTQMTTVLHNDSVRIGLLVLKHILPGDVELSKNENNLQITSKRLNRTIQVRNWDTTSDHKELHRISVIEFTDPLMESITIAGLDRFGLQSDLNKIKSSFELAAENVEKMKHYTPLTSIGIKCIISNYGFGEETEMFQCIGLHSMYEQAHFVQNNCQVGTLDLWKSKATTSEISQVLSKMKNDLTLYDYTDNISNRCDTVLKVDFYAKYMNN